MTTVTTRAATVPKALPPHPLRAEVVRGFPPLAGAAVLLMLGVLLTASSRTWQGGWAETAALTHDALLIALPLTAAAGCWQGGRERRRHTEELWGTAVRAPLHRLLASALPVALWVAVGYLVAVALAALATWPYSMGDHPHLTRVPGDTAALMAAALLGHLVGRVVPTQLAAPVLGVVGYAGLGMAARQNALDALDPAAFAVAGTHPVWWQPLAMAAWTLGLALALTLVYAARRRATALLPLAAALTAGALLVQGGSGMWRSDPLADRQVCDTSTTPAICVNARYAGLLPEVTTALSRATGRLSGVRNLPVRWADRQGTPRAGEVQLPTLAPFGWYVVRGRLMQPQQYAWEAVAALSGHGDCVDRSEGAMLADDAVQAYLAPSPFQSHFDARQAEGDAPTRAQLRRSLAARAKLAGMDEQRRRAWLSAYFAVRAHCGTEGMPSL
ncbi:hypothetical protein D0Z67_09670 [Streptomyces seoulensis]|uniref:Uncharacterized protein n=1 Tax=Streptomyces seoulensis TaxID=73044 RepID=A0A4P6TVY3_STRSO|nr:hypothetical protein [Streptomyces seoulensis]QBJ90551.1 hypothetical protein D0Z67_09670 [Streptomyces seoulensis]